ncbi:MAG: cyclic nucleotide-binding domain-containing protein [Desulfobacterales bacterium]|nr:cyclic nucleotide-binding domain-containing protein [Desulfobacterales bacterium]
MKIKKIKVTTGVFWVDIAEANLYILCGCPADAVKHLMKRRLIIAAEKGGHSYETGPNAILLSDISIQNGSVANLSEFPILQMLYRQGMILPNHPGNTGLKPMLIGNQDQVDAQSQYIFRGNYGLTTIEELMETGLNQEQAEILMRMKMRFSFDRIYKTHELLDIRVIGNQRLELRNSVFISRISVNVFRIEYHQESITVDLNLSNIERYEPPYQLGFHSIKREYFSVIHIGEGDGWDVNRPCMASLLTFQGKIYLIDASPNIQQSLISLGINVNDIEGIFHTHAHDDHFAGLTTLVRSDRLIKYYSTRLVRASVMKKLSALMSLAEDKFSRYFNFIDLEVDQWNNIGGLEVKPIFSPHPVETNIFIFRTYWHTGYKSYAHYGDIVSLDVLKNMIRSKPTQSGITKDFYEQVKRQYLISVDLKKIDIGGGLIHGNAEDFVSDQTEKITLSHISRSLTIAEQEIGSDATFGLQDVLIHAQQDYALRTAFNYLKEYFPTVPLHELNMLLNCPVVLFNGGSILIKKGTMNEYIYLILMGVVEYIESKKTIRNMLSTGSIIGELSGISGTRTLGTYRTASYVQALQMPTHFYLQFAKRNGVYKNIKRIHNNRNFLSNTWLFGEMASYPVQNRIADRMNSVQYKAGHTLCLKDKKELYLLEQGLIDIYVKDKKIETVESGGFFGEENILYEHLSPYHVQVMVNSKLFIIPREALEDTPIVQWKLFETYTRRLQTLDSAVDKNNACN